MLDRNDIHIEVSSVDYEKLSSDRLGESSATTRQRVQAARHMVPMFLRERQMERFAGTARIASRTCTGTTCATPIYFMSDQLGSTSLATSSTGALIAETRYKAWGEVRYTTANTTLPTPYTYTGQRSDSYINLLWYGSRHYDPELGRFIQPDTIVPSGVQGLDRYAYVGNNPVNFTDPTGHDPSCRTELECAKLHGWLNPNQAEVSTIVQTQSQETQYVKETLGLGANGCGVVAASYAGASLQDLANAVKATNEFYAASDETHPGGIQPSPYTQALRNVFSSGQVNEYRRTDPARLLKDLSYEMQLGNCVIVDFVPTGANFAHFALVTDINFKTGMITLDNTMGGKPFSMSFEDFYKAWYNPEQKASNKSGAENMDYWAVVIRWRKFNPKMPFPQ
jgi:RHS repeat-associated protein